MISHKIRFVKYKMKKGYILKSPIACIFMAVTVSFGFLMLISTLRLPEISLRNQAVNANRSSKIVNVAEDEGLGKFGEMMISMLPDDLAFTVFIPSDQAFERDLRLYKNNSFEADKMNDTYAIVSRILGFSAVPRRLLSTSVDVGKDNQISYDSLSGLRLFIAIDVDGMLVVNRVRSERVDMRKKEIVFHIMEGVLMDAEFELSMLPDYDEGEEN